MAYLSAMKAPTDRKKVSSSIEACRRPKRHEYDTAEQTRPKSKAEEVTPLAWLLQDHFLEDIVRYQV
jgi:hypothetical protein